MKKELFRIEEEDNIYILYVYGKEYMKSDNIDLLTAEMFRVCLI